MMVTVILQLKSLNRLRIILLKSNNYRQENDTHDCTWSSF